MAMSYGKFTISIGGLDDSFGGFTKLVTDGESTYTWSFNNLAVYSDHLNYVEYREFYEPPPTPDVSDKFVMGVDSIFDVGVISGTAASPSSYIENCVDDNGYDYYTPASAPFVIECDLQGRVSDVLGQWLSADAGDTASIAVDRSTYANDLLLSGTLSHQPVHSRNGVGLTSGWSASNYLSRPVGGEFDFSAGVDMAFVFSESALNASANECYFAFYHPTILITAITFRRLSTGEYRFDVDGNVVTTKPFPGAGDRVIACGAIGNVLFIAVDGELFILPGNNVSYNFVAYDLYIGYNPTSSEVCSASVGLFKIIRNITFDELYDVMMKDHYYVGKYRVAAPSHYLGYWRHGVDYIALAYHTVGSAGAGLKVQWSDDGMIWTDAHTLQLPADDSPFVYEFPQVAHDRIRVLSDTVCDIGLLKVGRKTVVSGPPVGWELMDLGRNVTTRVIQSELGLVLGSVSEMNVVDGDISMINVPPQFLALDYAPILPQLRSRAFFYRRDYACLCRLAKEPEGPRMKALGYSDINLPVILENQ